MDLAIAVSIFKLDKPCHLPVLEPFRHILIFDISHLAVLFNPDSFEEVRAGEHGDSGGSGIENRDEQQSPSRRDACFGCTAHRVKPNDNVWQSRCAEHQRRRDKKDINSGFAPIGVSVKAEFFVEAVESVKKIHAGAIGDFRDKSHLRNHVVGDKNRDENGRHEIGEDQDAVLRYLRVGDAFHATKHGVKEDDAHADEHADIDVDVQEPGEDDADTAHLSGDVGKRDEDGTYHGDNPRQLRIIPFADEIRNGVFPEFPEVGCQQQREQNIAACPSKQIDGTVAAHEGDEPCHGDEGGGTHPIGGGCQAVDDGMHVAPGDIEIPC